MSEKHVQITILLPVGLEGRSSVTSITLKDVILRNCLYISFFYMDAIIPCNYSRQDRYRIHQQADRSV